MENDYEANAISANTQPSCTFANLPTTKQENADEGTKSAPDKFCVRVSPYVLIGVLSFIVFGLPITEVVTGSVFKNQCPINPLIPIYLIVTGVATLTLILLIILMVRFLLSLKNIQCYSFFRLFQKSHRFSLFY
jgi:hypothetical protein